MGYIVEWSERKSLANQSKHGVDFHETATAFGDPISINLFDPDHSAEEDRGLLLGRSAKGRILVVSYTERPPRTRIISARPATRRERSQYATH